MPVAPAVTCREFARFADEVVCPYTTREFVAVGNFYDDFSPVSDDDVAALLAESQDY